MEIPFDPMRADFADLVSDWGESCAIKRNTGTTNTQGRRVDNWTALATETLWVQPLTVTDRDRQDQGVVEGTTHVGFQAWAGTPLQETDQVTVGSDPFHYDVLGVVIFPNHRKNWLKQVKK